MGRAGFHLLTAVIVEGDPNAKHRGGIIERNRVERIRSKPEGRVEAGRLRLSPRPETIPNHRQSTINGCRIDFATVLFIETSVPGSIPSKKFDVTLTFPRVELVNRGIQFSDLSLLLVRKSIEPIKPLLKFQAGRRRHRTESIEPVRDIGENDRNQDCREEKRAKSPHPEEHRGRTPVSPTPP